MWTGARALYFRHQEVSTCPNSYRNYKKIVSNMKYSRSELFWTQEKSNGSTIWRIWSNIPWLVHFAPRVYNILHKRKFLRFEVFINRGDLGLSGKVLAAWLNKQMTLWINITIIWEKIKQWKIKHKNRHWWLHKNHASFILFRISYCLFRLRLNCLNSTAWVQ